MNRSLMERALCMIAGLGNPGKKYERTRHNAGFLALDALAREAGIDLVDKKWKALSGRGTITVDGVSRDVVLIKPQNFMNTSGESVAPALKHYKVPLDHLLVLHDESELPFGEIREKLGGGHKGHNGLRDIIAESGGADFYRLRLGMGRPPEGSPVGLADYLLAPFSSDQQAGLEALLYNAVARTRDWLKSRP